VKAAEARRLVAKMGLTEAVARVVGELPAELPDETIALLRQMRAARRDAAARRVGADHAST
jgi:hypothetical protein